jgi:hypothetical protein
MYLLFQSTARSGAVADFLNLEFPPRLSWRLASTRSDHFAWLCNGSRRLSKLLLIVFIVAQINPAASSVAFAQFNASNALATQPKRLAEESPRQSARTRGTSLLDRADKIRSVPDSMAIVVEDFDFGHHQDRNRDGWPDNWQRIADREHPQFITAAIQPREINDVDQIKVARRTFTQLYLSLQERRWPWQIVAETVPEPVEILLENTISNPCLSIAMDTGEFEMQSPPIDFDSNFSYAVELQIKTDSLEQYDGRLELRVHDRSGQHKQIERSQRVAATSDWQSQRLGPFDLDRADLVTGRIHIIVTPTDRTAFRGHFQIDGIRLWKMPKLSISLSDRFNVFALGDQIKMQCKASGLRGMTPQLDFKVHDHNGNEAFSQRIYMLAADSKDIDGKDIDGKDDPAAESPNESNQGAPLNASSDRNGESSGNFISQDQASKSTNSFSTDNRAAEGWAGVAELILPDLPPGYYNLACEMPQVDGKYRFRRESSFVILPPLTRPNSDRRFGWALDTDAFEDVTIVPDLLRAARVGATKFPVWTDPADTRRSDLVAWLIERLATLEIECVGMIDLPPKGLRSQFVSDPELTISSMMSQSKTWQSMLQPVIARLSLQLNKFQLGQAYESELTNNPNIVDDLRALRDQIKLFSTDAELTIPWDGMSQRPTRASDFVDRVELFFQPGLRPSELASISPSDANQVPISVTLETLEGPFSVATQVRDLTLLMSQVIESNMGQVWFSTQSTLNGQFIDSTGQPGPLFLPFRTLSETLAGHQYRGNFMLLNNTPNRYFSNGTSGTMLLWSANPDAETGDQDQPNVEQLYFGDDVQARDIWGSPIEIETVQTEFGPEQVIPIHAWPVIVYNIDDQVARWRLGLKINDPQIETIIGSPTDLGLRFANSSGNAVFGEIRLIAQKLIGEKAAKQDFAVPQSSSSDVNIPLSLRPDAGSQDLKVRLDVRLTANRDYRFSVFRSIQVGLHDIQVAVTKSLTPDDTLVLRLNLTNRGDQPANFDCMLLMADRPRQRTQFVNATDQSQRVLIIPNASELAGQSMWLRCQEVGTNRVLNQRINLPAPDAWGSEFEIAAAE